MGILYRIWDGVRYVGANPYCGEAIARYSELDSCGDQVHYIVQSVIFKMQRITIDSHLEDILGRLTTKVGVSF